MPKQSFNFCKFEKLFAESKRRTKELSYYVSFVIFGHETCELEGGGGKIAPPLDPKERVKFFSTVGLNPQFSVCSLEME